MKDVTRIPLDIGQGPSGAADELLPLVYDELRRLAARRLADEPTGQTFQATDLVHEAFLRLAHTEPARGWDSRGHFFAAAAEAMRRILVENARRRHSQKRGGRRERQPLEAADLAASEPDQELLALDEALGRLETADPLKAELVKLRYFAGLTILQAAEVLGISTATASRHWTFARAWLRREVDSEGLAEPDRHA